MNPLSAIVRIICGLVVIILAVSMYGKNRAAIAAGGEVRLFGFQTAAEPWQLTLAFVTIGIIGVVMLILGVMTFVKGPR